MWDEIETARGEVTDLYALLLQSPALARPIERLSAHVRFDADLPARVKHLVALTLATHYDCEHVWLANESGARSAGLTEDTIDSLRRKQDPVDLDASDALVFRLCSQLLSSHRVSEDSFAEAREAFGERRLVELAGLIGFYAMVSVITNIFDEQSNTEPSPPARHSHSRSHRIGRG